MKETNMLKHGDFVQNGDRIGWVIISDGNIKLQPWTGEIVEATGFKLVKPIEHMEVRGEDRRRLLAKISKSLQGSPLRIRAYAALSISIVKTIDACRTTDFPNYKNILHGLKTSDFAGSGVSPLDDSLTSEETNLICQTVCEIMGFTIEEARKVEDNYRKKWALQVGLNEEASWKAILLNDWRIRQDKRDANDLESSRKVLLEIQDKLIADLQDASTLNVVEECFRYLISFETYRLAVMAIRYVQDEYGANARVSNDTVEAIIMAYNIIADQQNIPAEAKVLELFNGLLKQSTN